VRRTPLRLIGCLAAGLPASAAAQKLALVIDNSAYQSMPALSYCAASGHTIASALRRAGFSITEKPDVSNGEMGSAIADFAAAAAYAPSAIVYICGYTLDFGGRDFLLPATASLEHDSDALTQGIAAKSLLDAVAAHGQGAHLVLLDLVTAPKHDAAAHLDALAPSGDPGLAAAVNATAPPQGASAFAAAAATQFARPELSLADAVTAIAAGGAGPDITVSHNAPPADVWLRGAPAPPSVSPPSATATMPDELRMTEADRRRIQQALIRLGYYDRQADGIFGADTRAAIRRFQHEIGAPMTGTITPDQSAKLLAGQH
jgi:hypothetical protein